ncbi:MAG: cupin domain-containing protein [Sphingomonadaceae bacterium]
MKEADALIARLGLMPHPEGGHYRETWRSPAAADTRAAMTGILFLLRNGERSHWHRVDADEAWAWHAGAPLLLRMAPERAGPVSEVVLGGKVLAGETVHAVVPAGHWQTAEARDGWALVSCFVAPGFQFEGFELAPDGWEPAG